MYFSFASLLFVLSWPVQTASAFPASTLEENTNIAGGATTKTELPGLFNSDLYKGAPEGSPPREGQEHLVIVACHAIWKGGPTLGESDNEWTLEPYQQGWNESLVWIKHIEHAVEIVKGYKGTAVLIFSGGETRPHGGARTESQSYWTLADARGLLSPELASLTTTENYAKDSLENVLFSICRFREFTGNYPRTITVVGYNFKSKRFSQVHREALRFPTEQFLYVGLDSATAGAEKIADMAQFEMSHSLKPFERDPYACFEPVLVEKKSGRNPGRRTHAYEHICPDLKGLFNWCGLDQSSGEVHYYPGKLPWTE